jgi:L-lysine exporter family protein LysE/ArgO
MKSVFMEGFILQAGLIFSLGAQNLYVLEAGLKKDNSLAVCVVCALCDLFLIMVGVAGAASLLLEFQGLKIFFGALGIIFLIYYGFSKLLTRPLPGRCSSFSAESGIKRASILAMSFSLLNPHAYLDAFVLIGGYSAQFSQLDLRISLGLGAALFSFLWFVLLSQAAAVMAPFLKGDKSMRIINSISGLMLIFLAGKLSLDVVEWFRHLNLAHQ